MSNDSNQTTVTSGQTAANNQQAQTVIERRPVQKTPIYVAEEPVIVRQIDEPRNSTLSELIKFGILAVILLAVPLIISLLNPIIFGRIVPAVLGSDLPQTAPSLPGDQVIQPPTAETPNVILPTDPETGIGGEGSTTTTPQTITEPDFHIVRSGDTINSIARQYGLNPADIVSLNNLQDPNHISSGQVLLLPTPTSP